MLFRYIDFIFTLYTIKNNYNYKKKNYFNLKMSIRHSFECLNWDKRFLKAKTAILFLCNKTEWTHESLCWGKWNEANRAWCGCSHLVTKPFSLALKRFELRGFKTAPYPLSREWQPRGRPSPSCRLAGRAADMYCLIRPSTGSPNLSGYMQLHDLLNTSLCKKYGWLRFFSPTLYPRVCGWTKKAWNCHKGWFEVKTKAVTKPSRLFSDRHSEKLHNSHQKNKQKHTQKKNPVSFSTLYTTDTAKRSKRTSFNTSF